jgi:hypothetical protein
MLGVTRQYIQIYFQFNTINSIHPKEVACEMREQTTYETRMDHNTATVGLYLSIRDSP